MSASDCRRLLNKTVRTLPGGDDVLDSVELFHKMLDRHPEHTETGKVVRLALNRFNAVAAALRAAARELKGEDCG